MPKRINGIPYTAVRRLEGRRLSAHPETRSDRRIDRAVGATIEAMPSLSSEDVKDIEGKMDELQFRVKSKPLSQ